MDKHLMSGNEAIAQGAWEAGCAVGVGYPGTPSTETLEALVRREDVYCEWAPNEKVALEVGLGAAIGGARSLVTMKHVGVNVAADPLMSACNTGVNAGLVLLAADDPSCYSSQNEQDSRFYAAFARIPCLSATDSAECYEMTRAAFELSERFDTPVMLHETMRIAHTRTLVSPEGVREAVEPRPYEDNIGKYVMMPANAVRRRAAVDERTRELADYAETCPWNRVETRGEKVGVICSGAVYQHVREALPDASTFKLGLVWPLPADALARFATSVEHCYVVEEASDYLSEHVRALGVTLDTPPAAPLPAGGELTPAKIRAAFGLGEPAHLAAAEDLPPRPPAFCPGCPHRLVFCELRRIKAIVTGDIGCYTLGAVAPYGACHTVIDMGASLSMAHGMELAGTPERTGRPVIGVIGDSTFAHSGITSLLGTIYNGGVGTLCILDNRTTAMTGTQGNPVNGVTLTDSGHGVGPLDNPTGKALDLIALCRALGVEDVREVDAQDLQAVRGALKDAVANADQLSVIVFKAPCRLVDRSRGKLPTIRDCRACGQCLKIGCPALGRAKDGTAAIDPTQCIGCDQCVQSCPFHCITKE
ncbi:thiamine pyrophosphate-dependent enzyme [Olsenella profusa]|uniref:Indolepyruvate oxidoreductase subunit IorA n=1 Tax=Olsenella profusa TaxID=138595 RepID=A0ABS2F475_9ACTN|nr:thiamine pyrophosphate-dependent enzyme [Olsenella profusa]MBM6775612.1 4Fe-4S binding protein [Olsenella profusa]